MTVLLFIILSLGYGVLTFLITGSIVISGGVGLAFLLTSFIYICPSFSSFKTWNRKRHECYRFVYSFIISLSSTNSGRSAFEAASEGTSGEEARIIEGISDFQLPDKLRYLDEYFLQDYYTMFLSIYDIYQERGGDILDIATPLLNEVAETEKLENTKNSKRIQHLIQNISLWGMSALILGCIRFALGSFYEQMTSTPLFLILTIAYFLVTLIGIVFFVSKETSFKRRKKKK